MNLRHLLSRGFLLSTTKKKAGYSAERARTNVGYMLNFKETRWHFKLSTAKSSFMVPLITVRFDAHNFARLHIRGFAYCY